jgi:hypothetical protein
MEYPTEVAGILQDVDQLLLWNRSIEQGVALGGMFPEPGSNRENDIGFLDPLNEFRRGCGADLAGEILVVVIERVEPAE